MGVCAEPPPLVYSVYRLVRLFGSVVWCLVGLCPGLRVFVASLAVDLASLCWSPRTPQFVGPSCLDTGAVAPLTGDRTGVGGGVLAFWGVVV
jgi:hypothetical protein